MTTVDGLRAPFPPHKIQQIKQAGITLDYVGHADITERLLDCDPAWTWAPVAFDAQGLPAFDADGGLWITLTVCGVTRYGYGEPQGRNPFDARKGAIGNALRNAAMRFGVALALWQKDAPGEHTPAIQEAKTAAAEARKNVQARPNGGAALKATEKQVAAIQNMCRKAGVHGDNMAGALSQLLERIILTIEDVHMNEVDLVFKAGPDGIAQAWEDAKGYTIVTQTADTEDPWAGETLV